MKLAGSAALVRELTRLTKLETVNGRKGLRQLLDANDKVELQTTEIAVAVANLLPNSGSTLTELDVRYSQNLRPTQGGPETHSIAALFSCSNGGNQKRTKPYLFL